MKTVWTAFRDQYEISVGQLSSQIMYEFDALMKARPELTAEQVEQAVVTGARNGKRWPYIKSVLEKVWETSQPTKGNDYYRTDEYIGFWLRAAKARGQCFCNKPDGTRVWPAHAPCFA